MKTQEEIAEYKHQWYLKNKEKILQYHKEYYEKNKEKISEKRKEYDKKNKEKVSQRRKEYYEKNKNTTIKNYYEKNKEKISEKRKEYQKEYREKNKEKLLEQKRNYYKENSDKIKENVNKTNKSLATFKLFNHKLNKYNICRQDPNNPELIQVKCKYCGRWFNPIVQQCWDRYKSINGTSTSMFEFYCSDGCKRACPIYNQKKWPKGFKPATSREVQPELRKMVLERDNWTCQKCEVNKINTPNVELHCHHIDPVINNPIESADMDNCITLCIDCHQEVHKLPGCGYHELRC